MLGGSPGTFRCGAAPSCAESKCSSPRPISESPRRAPCNSRLSKASTVTSWELVGTRGNPGRSSGYVQKALKRLNFTEVSIKKLEKKRDLRNDDYIMGSILLSFHCLLCNMDEHGRFMDVLAIFGGGNVTERFNEGFCHLGYHVVKHRTIIEPYVPGLDHGRPWCGAVVSPIKHWNIIYIYISKLEAGQLWTS